MRVSNGFAFITAVAVYVFHHFKYGAMLTNSARLGSALSLLRLSVCMYVWISAVTAMGGLMVDCLFLEVEGNIVSHMHCTL